MARHAGRRLAAARGHRRPCDGAARVAAHGDGRGLQGSEVAGALTGAATSGPVRVDLRGLLVGQARALGIEAVSVSPWCTAHDHERFFSHRASRGGDGRQCAYLGAPIA
ncbi:MAG: hypothetical protein DMD74_06640 [Gemmatimonadetes bacterium]|nr:MAG: hypothetical protein DMD74_06640 [Gemmatimonadota bacterium]